MARDCGFCFYVRKCGLMIWLRSFCNIMKLMNQMSEANFVCRCIRLYLLKMLQKRIIKYTNIKSIQLRYKCYICPFNLWIRVKYNLFSYCVGQNNMTQMSFQLFAFYITSLAHSTMCTKLAYVKRLLMSQKKYKPLEPHWGRFFSESSLETFFIIFLSFLYLFNKQKVSNVIIQMIFNVFHNNVRCHKI